MNELNMLRKKIDRIDQKILNSLAKRMMIVSKIGEYKRQKDISILDADRKSLVLDSWLSQGEALGLDQSLVKDIYNLLHAYALEQEKEVEK